MYLWLGFSSETASLLVREQWLDSPERLRVFTDENVNDICNVMRKPGSKNANEMPDRGQQASALAQENLKLAVVLFYHQWRCTFGWEVMGVWEDTVHLLVRQKWLKNKYKDPDMMPKVNKADMAGMMESIKEYLRSCCGVKRALAYITRKTIIVQIYGDYPNMQLLMMK